MGLPVVTVAAGGLPVVESTIGGTPVTEATNGYGVPVTKVVGKPGLPVVFETIGVASTGAAFDPLTAINVDLSDGNLQAMHNSTVTNSGVKGIFKNSGKYYFEMKMTTTASAVIACGLITQTGTFANVLVNSTECTAVYFNSGNIVSNGGGTGKNIGTFPINSVLGLAVDFGARLAWLRQGAGNWNADAAANPATGVGGVAMTPAVSFAPVVCFGNDVAPGRKIVACFGATSFANAAPAGFGNWPAA